MPDHGFGGLIQEFRDQWRLLCEILTSMCQPGQEYILAVFLFWIGCLAAAAVGIWRNAR